MKGYPSPTRKFAAACTALFGLLCVSPAFAATDYWTGAANSTWDATTLNWSSDSAGDTAIAFTGGDDVIFSATSVTGTPSVAQANTITVGNLTFDGNTTITGSGNTTVAGTLTVQTGVNATISNALTSNGSGTSGNLTVYGNLTVSGAINNNIVVNGSGNTTFSGLFNGSGSLTINGGTVKVTTSQGLGKIKGLTINSGGTFDQEGNNFVASKVTATVNTGGTWIIGAGFTTAGNVIDILNGGGTIQGGTGSQLVIGNDSNKTGSFSGNMTDALSFTIQGGLHETISGVNSYTGTTTIGGTSVLTLGIADSIANTSQLILSGGTLAAGSFSQHMGSTTLALTANSTITLTGSSTLIFANSSGVSWTAGTLLTITDAAGNSIQFGTDNTGLTSAQLAQITLNGSAVTLDTSGYLVSAIPEPAAFGLLGGFAALAAVIGYRRKIRRATTFATS